MTTSSKGAHNSPNLCESKPSKLQSKSSLSDTTTGAGSRTLGAVEGTNGMSFSSGFPLKKPNVLANLPTFHASSAFCMLRLTVPPHGPEYRGLRTKRYTYARSLQGPWLLYDNEADPYQMENLVDSPDAADLLEELDQRLNARLALMGDEFLTGDDYLQLWGYEVDEKGTVPYGN